jgi:6-phosphofructokinase 1
MTSRIRRIGVVTSGADSPGLNACIRGAVRGALAYDWEPWGIRSGFAGLLSGDMMALNSRSVSHKIGLGGTFLGTSLEQALEKPHGLRDMLRNLNEVGLDALIVIGDMQAMRTAHALQEAGVRTMGVPCTIENNLRGTDYCVGYDTALNTALDALDRIRDTATAQQQAYLVEMVGDYTGHLVLMTGIAGGAEMVCIPEVPFSLEDVATGVSDAYIRGKDHCVITLASGVEPSAAVIAEYLSERRDQTGFAVHVTALGPLQRGGAPSAFDRFLGTRLSAAAIDKLQQGVSGMMVGLVDGKMVTSPLSEVIECYREIEPHYLELAEILAR